MPSIKSWRTLIVRSQVLSSYLLQRGLSSLKNKTVLELGSGTGLVGLVAGYLGAEHVWITDQRSVCLYLPSPHPYLFTLISELAHVIARLPYLLLRTLQTVGDLYIATVPSSSPLLDIMRQNVQLNSLGSTVTAAELNWCFALFALLRTCVGKRDHDDHSTLP